MGDISRLRIAPSAATGVNAPLEIVNLKVSNPPAYQELWKWNDRILRGTMTALNGSTNEHAAAKKREVISAVNDMLVFLLQKSAVDEAIEAIKFLAQRADSGDYDLVKPFSDTVRALPAKFIHSSDSRSFTISKLINIVKVSEDESSTSSTNISRKGDGLIFGAELFRDNLSMGAFWRRMAVKRADLVVDDVLFDIFRIAILTKSKEAGVAVMSIIPELFGEKGVAHKGKKMEFTGPACMADCAATLADIAVITRDHDAVNEVALIASRFATYRPRIRMAILDDMRSIAEKFKDDPLLNELLVAIAKSITNPLPLPNETGRPKNKLTYDEADGVHNWKKAMQNVNAGDSANNILAFAKLRTKGEQLSTLKRAK